jgi:hypothetical protein
MSEKIPEVYKAIAAIVNETGSIPKTGYNDYHQYAYTREEDIVNTLKKQFAAHQVILLPNVTRTRRVGESTLINVEFTLMSLKDGSKHVFNVPGEGADKGDKGTPKALTMAIKYALSKQFLIASGDDAEADTATDARSYGAKSTSTGSNDLFSRGTSEAASSDEEDEAPKAAPKASLARGVAAKVAKATTKVTETEEAGEEQEDVLLSRAQAATSSNKATAEDTEETAAPEAATEDDSEEESTPKVTSKASDILAKWKTNKEKSNTASLARRA